MNKKFLGVCLLAAMQSAIAGQINFTGSTCFVSNVTAVTQQGINWLAATTSSVPQVNCPTPPPPPSGSCTQGQTGDISGFTALCRGTYKLHAGGTIDPTIGDVTTPYSFPFLWGTVFNGSIVGNTLSVKSFSRGRLAVGDPIYGTGVADGTVITQVINVGTYKINNAQSLTGRAMTGKNWPGANFGATDIFAIGQRQFLAIPFKPVPGHTITLSANNSYTPQPVSASISEQPGQFNNGVPGNGVVCVIANRLPSLVISSNGLTASCQLDQDKTYWYNVVIAQFIGGRWVPQCSTATCGFGVTNYSVN